MDESSERMTPKRWFERKLEGRKAFGSHAAGEPRRTKMEMLEDENKNLVLRLERQRRSLKALAEIVKATKNPLESLPLEVDDLEGRLAGASVDEEPLSANDASVLTIANLRELIETMEEERTEIVGNMQRYKEENEHLRAKGEAQAVKISAYEKLFQKLNSGDLTETSQDVSKVGSQSEESLEEYPPMVITPPRGEHNKKLFVAPPSASYLLPEEDRYDRAIKEEPERLQI